MFARKRIHARLATEVVLTHAAIVQAIAGGEHLKDLLKGLQEDGSG